MAQTGFTPLLIYSSSTATNAPTAGNLLNNATGSELAINITDGKLFYKDNSNVVQVIGWKTTPATAGGTGLTSFAIGDLIYADTTTTLAKLADVATGNAFISGGVGVAPSYGKIGLTTHVSGTLPVANGGTNLTSFTANGIVYASSTSALSTGSALTFDGTNFATTGKVSSSNLNGSMFTATMSANQNITTNTFTKLVFDTTDTGTAQGYNFTTRTFTPTVAGWYSIIVSVYPNTATTVTQAAAYLNGNLYKRCFTSVANEQVLVSCIVYMNGSTDYIEAYGYLTGVTPQVSNNGGLTFFEASFMRGA
jgi:hypothetical protein